MNQAYTSALCLLIIALGWVQPGWVYLGGVHLGWGAELEIDFVRDIRPLLSEACFHCHGPDEQAREADLQLDTYAGLTQDLGGYAAVVPGDVEASELVRRIQATDASEQMPPPDSNKSLTAEQRALLVKWVQQGAKWEQHWAFIAPQQPSLPEPAGSAWCRNEIDFFILDRLEKAGLSPAEDAPPYTLVRRLFLDLIGLPPEPAEADAWVAKIWPNFEPATNGTPSTEPRETWGSMDESAYQRLVSELLNSPHYGERWARRWLDLARYADTNGYEKDRDRSIWPYRDWVVQALNRDLPFDQFTIQQLAGDMLPAATLEQNIATGFHRNTMLNEEGGIDPLEFRYHAMTDRVATTGTTWLGLTLGCCQCHTHKYDPITHTEYFGIMALLNNADEPTLELPGEDFETRWRDNQAQAERLLAELPGHWPLPEQSRAGNKQKSRAKAKSPVAAVDAMSSDPAGQKNAAQPASEASPEPSAEELAAVRQAALERAFAKWLSEERQHAVAWQRLQPLSATSSLPILTIEDDQSIFASGDTAKRDDYYLEFAPSPEPITALQLEALPDERLPARGPGSTYYEGTLGDFYLTELRLQSNGQPLPLASASETYAKNRFGNNPASAALAVDGDVQTGWSVHGRQGERHVAVFVLTEPLPANQPLSIQMTFGRHFASSLGRFRWSATSTRQAAVARDYPPAIVHLLQRSAESWSASERQQLLEQFLMGAPEVSAQAERIRTLRARPDVPTTLVLSERPAAHPRPTFRHHRGEYLQPEEEVAAGVPAILPPLPADASKNRLAFARWLVASENPLTARVAVNRQWAALFGTGLVKTLDDFGLQGEAPSHPALLDWLALQFMHADGWSMKALHRRLVSSRTYRQASQVNSTAEIVDPENRLLSYAPRLRLDAEVLRDSLLVASGTLSRELGGPPVKPPQPKGITEVTFGSPKWDVSSGADRYRRSLYTFIKRTAPFAMYATFDAPSGEACIAQRTRNNSPLQALTLLNDVMLIDLARAAAQRFATADTTEVEPLSQLFRAVLVRPPRAEELELLHTFYRTQRDRFAAQPALARELLEDAPGEPAMLASQAAWAATARALFAVDEALTRE